LIAAAVFVFTSDLGLLGHD
jgi:hypothetical protein